MRRWSAAAWVVLSALGAGACSSVPHFREGREGLLDRLGKPVSSSREPSPDPERLPAGFKPGSFRWPLQNVAVTSPYGKRKGGFHEGIDLRAGSGTPVFAADAGTVIYADRRIRGYGRMVVLRHPSGLTTVYAHNSRLHVRKGQRVKRGQKIALSGRSGRVSGPHLHFEVRNGVSPVDPFSVLPPVQLASAREPQPSKKPGRRVARGD